jgi:hypothetical protein
MQPKRGELVPSIDPLTQNCTLAIAPIPILTSLPKPVKTCALPLQICMEENEHVAIPKSILVDIEKIEDLWVDENGEPISEIEKKARNSKTTQTLIVLVEKYRWLLVCSIIAPGDTTSTQKRDMDEAISHFLGKATAYVTEFPPALGFLIADLYRYR